MTANKVWKWTSNILWVVTFTTLLVMTLIVLSSRASGGEPELFGYQFKTVLSGSMEPTFKTGSIIAVKLVEDKNSLSAGDVITYQEGPGTIVTHRIIDVIQNGEHVMYSTKGDNNESADTNPVLSQNVIAVYSGITIPFLGYFLGFASSAKGTAILLIVPGLFLLGYSAFTIRSVIKEIEAKVAPQKPSDETEKTA
ncbi:signal peptidase I [Anaerobacillus alkaliphilus]|uniref:Signal peptidase I n=1 Tax=Anaerobacillus alkaliphilus TaxID=1548597 RepID=A0A4Q0VUZ7_9BACI|nr:signal peptidase I [Anaerobacillus alkaliphilus]RXJ01757.1 signal peptidase I [Anaerobacillus alkaliphilus]